VLLMCQGLQKSGVYIPFSSLTLSSFDCAFLFNSPSTDISIGSEDSHNHYKVQLPEAIMGQSLRLGKFLRGDWEHLLGTHVGTSSGTPPSIDEMERTGVAFTGYELIEAASNAVSGKPFTLSYLLDQLAMELKHGTVIMLESPTRGNTFGKFRYDNTHEYSVHGWPMELNKRDWFEDVLTGVDPAVHK
jgi:hypothetical protein